MKVNNYIDIVELTHDIVKFVRNTRSQYKIAQSLPLNVYFALNENTALDMKDVEHMTEVVKYMVKANLIFVGEYIIATVQGAKYLVLNKLNGEPILEKISDVAVV